MHRYTLSVSYESAPPVKLIDLDKVNNQDSYRVSHVFAEVILQSRLTKDKLGCAALPAQFLALLETQHENVYSICPV